MIENVQGVIENYPILCGVGFAVLLVLLLVMHIVIKQIKFMIKFGIFILLLVSSILALAYFYESNGNSLPFLN